MNHYFDLAELAKVCKKYNHQYKVASENSLVVYLNKEISLEFANTIEEPRNYIGFDTGDHFHGIDIDFTFFIDDDFYHYKINYLNLIPCLHNRELLIRSDYKKGKAISRYLFHKDDVEALDIKQYLTWLADDKIDELRVTSIP
jgi:hypothetical protein